ANLVAELPLNMVEIQRQVAIRLDVGTEDIGDHLLVGRAEQQVAFVPILDAQHLLAVIIVATAFAPQIGGLDGRHHDFLVAGPVLFLTNDLADLDQHALTEWQPRKAAGSLLPDHAGAQHHAVRDDLRFAEIFLQDWQKIARQSHVQVQDERRRGINSAQKSLQGFLAISRALENPRQGLQGLCRTRPGEKNIDIVKYENLS